MLRALLLGISLSLPLSPVQADDTGRWLREPALSREGTTLAFTYAGDIFQVDSRGGMAVPLTMTASVESNPAFSPDGRLVAYSSDRHGTLDVYVLSLDTGETKRLTYHETDDVALGFSADGTSVLFRSARYKPSDYAADPHQRQPELYRVSLEGGTPVLVTPVNALQATEDATGGRILYADQKGERIHRKHDDSPFARDVWVLDLASGRHERLTTNRWNDHTPSWDSAGTGFYFLSERSGSMNVWYQPDMRNEDSVRQLSFHRVHPVSGLSVAADGSVAYGFDGEIYLQRNPGAAAAPAEAQKVSIQLPAVDHGDLQVIAEVEGSISEFVVSPNDDEVAFVLRGDVYVTSVDFGSTRRITSTPGMERDLAFTSDGRSLLYAAERIDQWEIFESRLLDETETHFSRATRVGEEQVIRGPERDGRAVAVTQPVPSPDGEKLAYVSDFSEVRVFDREQKRSVSVVSPEQNYANRNGATGISWSPDSRYLAVDFQPSGRLFFENIALVPADGSAAPFDLSRSGYNDTTPRWHASGDFIVWATSRYGLREHGGHGALTDVFAQFLNQDAYDRFRRTKEELAALEEDDSEEDDSEEDEEETPPPAISFDPAEFEDRQARLTIHSSDLADFVVNEDASRLFYLSAFEGGYDLWAHDFREETTARIALLGAEAASMALARNGEYLVVLADGVLSKVTLAEDEATIDAIPIDLSPVVDTHAERQAMLHHIWQSARNHLFEPAFLEEAAWDDLYEHYAGKLDHVYNNADFAALARELAGELNVSHTNYTYVREATEPTGALGVILDHSDHDNGIRISEVLAKGPLAEASDRADTDHRITAVNDVSVTEGSNFYDLTRDRVGKTTRVTLSDGRESYEVVLKPVTHEEEKAWRADRWVESRHQLVEELSNGRLGYVYLPNMSDESYRRVYSDLFGRHFAKEGIVIDVRDNRGGDLVNWLVTLFTGRQYMWNIPDGRVAQGEPLTRWVKAKIALTNQGAYSDGHCFVAAWKYLKISTVVGTPLTGTCTYAGWERLVSGDVQGGTPTLGIKDADGDWMDRKTTWPDVTIHPDPNRYSAGEDAMLEKAVEVLLREIDTGA